MQWAVQVLLENIIQHVLTISQLQWTEKKKNEIYQLRSESSMANSTAHHKADIVTTSLSYTILVECVSLPDDRMSSDLSVIFTQSLQIRREKLPEKRDRWLIKTNEQSKCNQNDETKIGTRNLTAGTILNEVITLLFGDITLGSCSVLGGF